MSVLEKDWWKKSVVYQIYPKSFNDSNGDGLGDIRGIIEKLGYLKDLGVDIIWLSPIYDSPQADGGYDIRNYVEIYEKYGTMSDFDELLEETHRHGMKIMMDLVVNHTSDEHHWFQEAKKSKDNPYRDYYIWRDGKSEGVEPNNWSSVFSGPAWTLDEATNQYYLHLFARKQPDLNWENENLRKEVYSLMKFWLDKGIDGFRMDVINFISKAPGLGDGVVKAGQNFGDGSPFFMNGPKIHDYLQEMNREVLSNYNITTVGEMPGVSPELAIKYTDPDEKELNMVFTFEHMDFDNFHGDKWDLKPLHLPDLKNNLSKWQETLNKVGWNSLYWNNHDQPRIVSRFGNDTEYRTKSAKMLAICLHMMKGTPYIYQGEEIGMTNVKFENFDEYQDIETLNMIKEKRDLGWSDDRIMKAIYTKGRDNARTPFQWDDSENAGFTTGNPWIQINPRYKEVNATSAVSDKDSIFYTYKDLIRLRKELDIITDGDYTHLMSEDAKVFAYSRETDKEKIIVLCNFSDEVVGIDGSIVEEIKDAKVVISNDEQLVDNTLSAFGAIAFLIAK